MTVDIGMVAMIVGLIGTFGGFIIWFSKLILRFEKLERQARMREQDTKIMLRSLQACLDGLHQTGANGLVTKMQLELQAYIFESR